MDKSMPELPKDCNNKNHFFKLFFRAVWQVSCQQGHLSKVFFCIITRAARGVINIILPINTTNTFSKIPLDKLLVETDSPFLSPVPMRGKKNEPSFIKYTIKKLAEIKNIDVNQMINITTQNFEKLFFN